MFSLVVMAALTTNVETPAWFRCGCSGYYGCGGCYGCWGCGGCYGGYGSWYGCHGCWGGGGYSYYSGCYGCSGYYGCGGGCYGCWGCYGCYGYSGYAPMYGPGPIMPSAPTGGDLGTPQKEKKSGTSLNPNRARLLVEVPADAKLFIDDQPIKMTATSKTFNTPTLEHGQSYYYMVKVEVSRDGVTHTETRKVVIRSGDEVSARFTEQGVIAAARASAAAR